MELPESQQTRLIAFGLYAAERRRERGLGKPETFNFLGFTHICGRTREGKFQVQRRTMRQRMRGKLADLKSELRRRRHHSIPAQGTWLGSVVRGWHAYYGVPNNICSLSSFNHELTRHWHRALCRRSQRGRITWARFRSMVDRWIPSPRITHPWPEDRFAVKTRGRSPVR